MTGAKKTESELITGLAQESADTTNAGKTIAVDSFKIIHIVQIPTANIGSGYLQQSWITLFHTTEIQTPSGTSRIT